VSATGWRSTPPPLAIGWRSARSRPLALSPSTRVLTAWASSRRQTSTASGSATIIRSLTPITPTNGPVERARTPVVSIRVTSPWAALPAPSWGEAPQMASQAPRSDQSKAAGTTAALSVRSITA
jgi:hypothetical protein